MKAISFTGATLGVAKQEAPAIAPVRIPPTELRMLGDDRSATTPPREQESRHKAWLARQLAASPRMARTPGKSSMPKTRRAPQARSRTCQGDTDVGTLNSVPNSFVENEDTPSTRTIEFSGARQGGDDGRESDTERRGGAATAPGWKPKTAPAHTTEIEGMSIAESGVGREAILGAAVALAHALLRSGDATAARLAILRQHLIHNDALREGADDMAKIRQALLTAVAPSSRGRVGRDSGKDNRHLLLPLMLLQAACPRTAVQRALAGNRLALLLRTNMKLPL